MSSTFLEQLKCAPLRPGCYLFRDQAGRVLYIGKARLLRNRVQVYRRAGADGRARLSDLLSVAWAAEFFVTDTEKEAVILEERLVKKHQPPLNVLLKDDKSFLHLQLETHKEWPKLSLARHKQKGKGEFFGPYPSAVSARRAKRLLMQAFGLRDCTDHTLNNRSRACLKHSIGMCLGPCVGLVTKEDYAEALDGARDVLTGNVGDRVAEETLAMRNASQSQDYENALRSRNRIQALSALQEKQKVSLNSAEDFDALGISPQSGVGGKWMTQA
ncbi:MAG: GIY-YIG nuclease family protein [Planctomycetota bacterium]|jgi:excinuclease ABC subunit C|nr:GIY-YIG nuclease family protein [Planctomycetota bacterium]